MWAFKPWFEALPALIKAFIQGKQPIIRSCVRFASKTVMDDYTGDSSSVLIQSAPAETVVGEVSDGRRYAVPWPDNKYSIFINGTNRALWTNGSGDLHVYDFNKDHVQQHTWQCVEKNGYFGFVNPQTNRFIGHNDDDKLHSAAVHHESWELMTVRQHPKGGYELLMPHWWHTLKKVGVVQGSDDVVLRQHISTAWQFVKVD